MSFVGPRALLPAEKESSNSNSDKIIYLEKIPGFKKRIQVKPGLTGIAQIFAPRDIDRKNKFRYDSIYLNNMSLFLDLKLIIISFYITFKGSWEKRGNKI
jgi:lipopolysaccharide/colanic/teichoic acid biosynthesis glycosyltransferase